MTQSSAARTRDQLRSAFCRGFWAKRSVQSLQRPMLLPSRFARCPTTPSTCHRRATTPTAAVLSTGGYHNAAGPAALHQLAVCWADLCQLAERHVERLVFGSTGTLSDTEEVFRLLDDGRRRLLRGGSRRGPAGSHASRWAGTERRRVPLVSRLVAGARRGRLPRLDVGGAGGGSLPVPRRTRATPEPEHVASGVPLRSSQSSTKGAHSATSSGPRRAFPRTCVQPVVVNNWAGNVTYSTERILRPRSTAEAQELIAGAEHVHPLGTRHSFSPAADSAGALLSTEHLNRIVEIGDRTVTVEAGIRYGELSVALHEHGLALPNLASLPHISVGGAIATGTHGSGQETSRCPPESPRSSSCARTVRSADSVAATRTSTAPL